MSTFVRCLAVVAVCLATGLVSVGCKRKPTEKEKPGTEEPAKEGAEGDIFEEEGEVSARKAAGEALGTTKMGEPKTDVELKTEKVDAPKVEEPKGGDIEM